MTATSLAEKTYIFRPLPFTDRSLLFNGVPDLFFLLHPATHQNNTNTEIIFRFGFYLRRLNLCSAEVENTFNVIS